MGGRRARRIRMTGRRRQKEARTPPQIPVTACITTSDRLNDRSRRQLRRGLRPSGTGRQSSSGRCARRHAASGARSRNRLRRTSSPTLVATPATAPSLLRPRRRTATRGRTGSARRRSGLRPGGAHRLRYPASGNDKNQPRSDERGGRKTGRDIQEPSPARAAVRSPTRPQPAGSRAGRGGEQPRWAPPTRRRPPLP